MHFSPQTSFRKAKASPRVQKLLELLQRPKKDSNYSYFTILILFHSFNNFTLVPGLPTFFSPCTPFHLSQTIWVSPVMFQYQLLIYSGQTGVDSKLPGSPTVVGLTLVLCSDGFSQNRKFVLHLSDADHSHQFLYFSLFLFSTFTLLEATRSSSRKVFYLTFSINFVNGPFPFLMKNAVHHGSVVTLLAKT